MGVQPMWLYLAYSRVVLGVQPTGMHGRSADVGTRGIQPSGS